MSEPGRTPSNLVWACLQFALAAGLLVLGLAWFTFGLRTNDGRRLVIGGVWLCLAAAWAVMGIRAVRRRRRFTTRSLQ